MFLGAIDRLVAGVIFTMLLAWAARADLRARRIPNRAVLWTIAIGTLASATVLAQPVGARRALLGLAVGFALWVPLWLAGVIGAGDVKLVAASGAWLGPMGVLDASLLAMVAGGVLAVGVLVRRQALGRLAMTAALWGAAARRGAAGALLDPGRATGMSASELLPYGVAIAAGAALAGWLPAAWLPLAPGW